MLPDAEERLQAFHFTRIFVEKQTSVAMIQSDHHIKHIHGASLNILDALQSGKQTLKG